MKCFKPYDIRGSITEEITPQFAYALGKAIRDNFRPQTVVIGRDCRLSGPILEKSLCAALQNDNIDVLLLGVCCTEEIYWAASNLPVDLGIMITASHNPVNENGFKIVAKGSIPLGWDNGLSRLEKSVNKFICKNFTDRELKPVHNIDQNRNNYIEWLVNYIKTGDYKKLRIIADCGNGCAGLLVKKLAEYIPAEIILVNNNPDGSFPNGVPNPLLPEKRQTASKIIKAANADFGVAWDGDADRCFFYDENGNFIEGYYLVGLLAQQILIRNPAEKIIHDSRLYWNTQQMVGQQGGISVKSKTGHTFMKEQMRIQNAIYGGEMSGHYYFRDFAYCDSGMLPFLLITNLLSESDNKFSDLVSDCIQNFPCSGEINLHIENAEQSIQKVANFFQTDAISQDWQDGLDLNLGNWRFSMRKSNTEALLRLNVESRGDAQLMSQKTREILNLLDT